MSQFAKMMHSLSKPFRNMGVPVPDENVQNHYPATAFDSLRIKDAQQVPSVIPALFQSRERRLDSPANLFPERTCKKAELDELEKVTLEWLNVLDGLKPYGLRGQIAGINTYLNRSTETATLACHGRDLPWTAPLNIFHNAGSEHIAMAKYLSLRKIGVSAKRLRLVWIEDQQDQTSRIVLAATFADRNYILDNRRSVIVEDKVLTQVRPYCSTNQSQFSLHWIGPDDAGWERSLQQLGMHGPH